MPERSIHELIQHGEALFEQGAYLDALDAFERVLSEDPDNVYALNDAGITCGELDQTREAVEHFERALALQPDFEAAFFGMIDVLLDAEKVEAAVHAFLRYEEPIPNTEEKQRYADALTHLTAPEDGSQPAPASPHAAQIQQAEELLMQDQPQEALAVLHEVLEQDPYNAHALNDAGHAYVDLGEAVEASRCFERALEADPGHQSAFYSLLDLLVRAESPELAVDVFVRYQEHMPDDAEKGKYAEALGGWAEQQSANAASGDSLPGEAYVSAASFPRPASSEGLRIAIVCGPDRKFITDIEEGLRQKGHAVHACYFDGKIDLQRIQQAMDWADVTWFEWCDNVLVHASQKLRKTSSVICRLHRYESFSDMPSQVNWDFVDTLVLVSPQILDILKERVPDIERRVDVQVVYNGLDLDRFEFAEREPGFDLAYVGYLHHRKNPSLLLQCMHALVRHDERYTLHIAGYHQQPDWELYFEHMVESMGLPDNIRTYGWVDDVSAWLEDKQYLISTSIHESFGYGIAEAMARGIKPVIHNFVGAKQLYPRKWLFNTVDEFVAAVRSEDYDSAAYRQQVEEHYSLHRQLDVIESLMSELYVSAADAAAGVAHGNKPQDTLEGVTVLMPFHRRTRHFERSLKEGHWVDIPLQIVCDGSPSSVREQLTEVVTSHRNIRVHHYEPNRGLAHANATAVQIASTPYCLFCDDDDYLVDACSFLTDAAHQASEPDVLFVTMPEVVAFNGKGQQAVQYDRRQFRGHTGRSLLKWMVTTGEMCALNAGTLYRTDDVQAIPSEDFFRVSEDYVRIVRLCARYPERRIRVASSGRYMRLIHDDSLSARTGYNVEKVAIHLLSMVVGASYLAKMGESDRDQFCDVLLQRGEVLQQSYDVGREVASYMASLIAGQPVVSTDEQEQAHCFLQSHAAGLPPEFYHFIPGASLTAVWGLTSACTKSIAAVPSA